MHGGNVVLRWAAGRIGEFWPKKAAHWGAGVSHAFGVIFMSTSGCPLAAILRLCRRRSVAPSSSPVTARMSGRTDDGTETAFDGALSVRPRQEYVLTTVPKALLIWATVPEAETHRLASATPSTLMPLPVRNLRTRSTWSFDGANRALNCCGLRYCWYRPLAGSETAAASRSAASALRSVSATENETFCEAEGVAAARAGVAQPGRVPGRSARLSGAAWATLPNNGIVSALALIT